MMGATSKAALAISSGVFANADAASKNIPVAIGKEARFIWISKFILVPNMVHDVANQVTGSRLLSYHHIVEFITCRETVLSPTINKLKSLGVRKTEIEIRRQRKTMLRCLKNMPDF
jgi:hypothetical protein